MKKSYIGIASGLVTIAVAILVPGSVFAGFPNNNDPSGWGKFTSGAASTDGQAFGEHASNPPPLDLTPDRPGRAGIGNALAGATDNPDASKHPSDLASALCSDPSAPFPCP